MSNRKIKIALVGAGMFGGDVHLRAYADVETSGIAPFLGRIGLDEYARGLADVEFELVAVATRTEKSALASAQEYSGVPSMGPARTPSRDRFETLDSRTPPRAGTARISIKLN